ncbi:translation initiation factor IF-3 [Linepithema humile]|uniref:translation initiation factor IF-3 n=1 Tax=Linepithema humile TaxID=83485 RepID=UPI00351EA7C0
MAFFRVQTVLRKAVYFIENFSQCRVTHDLRVYRHQAFSKKSILENDDATAAKKPRPKTVPVPKITLLLPDNSITVTVLEEAQRLAKRRNLNLVKISDFDSKTERPSYKLTTTFLEESEEEDASKYTQKSKGIKLFYISAKIGDNDLRTKTKNLLKLLNKGHKVKIVINLDEAVEDKVQSNIEEVVKNYGDIQRMPSKKNVVLLLIKPLLNSKNRDSSVKNNEEIGASSTISQSDNI